MNPDEAIVASEVAGGIAGTLNEQDNANAVSKGSKYVIRS